MSFMRATHGRHVIAHEGDLGGVMLVVAIRLGNWHVVHTMHSRSPRGGTSTIASHQVCVQTSVTEAQLASCSALPER